MGKGLKTGGVRDYRGSGARRGRLSNSEGASSKGDDEQEQSFVPVALVPPEMLIPPSLTTLSSSVSAGLGGNGSSGVSDDYIFSLCNVPDWEGQEVVLNRRGTPIRSQKRNRIYYGDDLVNAPKIKTRVAATTSKKLAGGVVGLEKEVKVEVVTPPKTEEFRNPEEIQKPPRHFHHIHPAVAKKILTLVAQASPPTPPPSSVKTATPKKTPGTSKGPAAIVPSTRFRTPPRPKINSLLPSMPDLFATPVEMATPTIPPEPPISSPTPQQLKGKREAEILAARLKNMLKLPKAYKWVCFEWFYSDIDHALFSGDNDFQNCLRDYFPSLKQQRLARAEWTFIRRRMGKPRRLSDRFFHEERLELDKRREKIRLIQKRTKLVNLWTCQNLPEEVPRLITIGSKVTARINKPQDGLFSGVVEAVDTANNAYRINFGQEGIGTQTVPDILVRSDIPPDTIPTTNMKFLRQGVARDGGQFLNSDLLKNLSDQFPLLPFSLPVEAIVGGFPARLLEMIVRLAKFLKVKQAQILTMRKLNVKAERFLAYGQTYPFEFRISYAECVVRLNKINGRIGAYLEGIRVYCKEIMLPSREGGDDSDRLVTSKKMWDPEQVLLDANKEASIIVSTYNCNVHQMEGTITPAVHQPKIVSLVEQMASLMLQIRDLAVEPGQRTPHDLKDLQETVQKMKASLEGRNLKCFQNRIEIPINRIIAGLCVDKNPKKM